MFGYLVSRRRLPALSRAALAAALLGALPSAWAEPLDLKKEAQAIAAAQLEKLGSSYRANYDAAHRLIYVSALDDTHLQETVALLSAYCDAQQKTLFSTPLPWNVAVVLPTVDDYKPLAPGKDITGFYEPKDRVLISIDRGRVLLHEFTHALHHAQMASLRQAHPVWICEGLATLFECCDIDDKGVGPLVDLRLPGLQKALRNGSALTLEKLLQADHDQFNRDAAVCYAQSRYLMLYLQQRGMLKKWYDAYTDGFSDNPSGKAALEKVLGKRLFEVEDDWKSWVLALRLPWNEGRSDQARLGVEVQADEQGVKVVGLIRGSAGEKAGLIKAGDIIKTFNGQAISNPAEFVAAVRSTGALRTVSVELLRNEQKVVVLQPMGSAKPD